MASTPVLIVGAGPTGLVLALWLTRLGVAVRIIDKLDAPAAYSRALGVQARTLELYHQVGIDQLVVERGVKVGGVNLWLRGAKVAHVPFRQLGSGLTPYSFALVFAQDQHERLLIDQLAALGVHVERGTELLAVEQSGDRVRATVRRRNGREETCESAYIAGCDGAHSVVRTAVGIGFPGATYSQLFYVADVDARGPASDGELHLDLDDADLLAVFPMGENHVRLVGTVRTEGRRDGDELTFADVSGRAIEHLQLAIDRVNWFSPYHVHHRVAEHFQRGRAFLLGDAAHIHSPVGAQGMNTGIGDAVNLAWKLAAVVQGGVAPRILDSFEPERIAFARRLVSTTDTVFTVATKRGPIAERVRTRLFPVLAPALLRLGPVRRFLFRTVSQLGIQYRNSVLSEGRAGSVHGGDRLPWVQVTPSEDNFAPLVSLAWQVHVYGATPAGIAATCASLDLELHAYGWNADMKRAGFAPGAVYVVRPDGYVGLADPSGSRERLREYVASRVH